MIKSIPNGVYPTMVTPFTKDNKIDYNGVLSIIEWYSKRGVEGIFAVCQSSEIFFLSFEERLELLRFIIANAPKGMTIIASGHTANDIETQIKEADKFIETGIDAYVFISNRLAAEKESDEVFLKNIHGFIKEIDEISLGIYECPYPYKRLMSPGMLRALAETGRFKFLKDTCCDLEMLRAKIDAVKGLGLKVFNANSATLLESLKMGAAGFSGVMANFHPELYSWLCKNYLKNKEKAVELQNFVGFASMAECQVYPVNAKYYLSLEGLNIGMNCRAKDSALLTSARQMEIEQMRNVTLRFKAQIGIE